MDNIYFILLLILIRETHALLLMGQSTSMPSALYTIAERQKILFSNQSRNIKESKKEVHATECLLAWKTQ